MAASQTFENIPDCPLYRRAGMSPPELYHGEKTQTLKYLDVVGQRRRGGGGEAKDLHISTLIDIVVRQRITHANLATVGAIGAHWVGIDCDRSIRGIDANIFDQPSRDTSFGVGSKNQEQNTE